jgi:hypothetical protein
METHPDIAELSLIEMRRLRQLGRTYLSIANQFGVRKSSAMKACKGQTWSHIPFKEQK